MEKNPSHESPEDLGQTRDFDIPSANREPSQHASPEVPLAYQAVRGGLWAAAGSYLNVGFGFAANLILTRILVPEDFGVFVLATFFFSMINIRSKIGVGQAFAQKKDITGKLVGSHLILDAGAGVATLLASLAAAPLLYLWGYHSQIAWVVVALSAAGVLESFAATPWVLLDKNLRFKYTSLVTVLAFPCSYVPAFIIALRGGGYWSLVAQAITYALFLLIGMWLMARQQLPWIWQLRWRFDKETALGLIRFGGAVGVALMAALFVSQFDNFLVGTLVSLATLGFYDRAYRIAQWPTLLVSAVVSRTALYTYVRLQDDSPRLERAVNMTLWIVSLMAVPLAAGIFASGPDLVRLFYGDSWLPAVVFLRFLVVYSVIRPLAEDWGSLFVAVGRPKYTMQVALLQATTLLTLGTLLTLRFGAIGTSVAVGITVLVGFGFGYWYVIRLITVRFWSSLGVPVLVASASLALYSLGIRLVDLDSWPLIAQAASKFIGVALTYLGLTLVLRRKETVHNAAYVWKLLRAGA